MLSQAKPALLRHKSREKLHEMKYRDELGTERISWPRLTGQLSVYLYASLLDSSTSALHANTILKPIVECENKGAVTIICALMGDLTGAQNLLKI